MNKDITYFLPHFQILNKELRAPRDLGARKYTYTHFFTLTSLVF